MLDLIHSLNTELSARELPVTEARRAFKLRRGKIVKVFRCSAGRRKGKTVSSPAVCFQKKNRLRAIKARRLAKRTRFIRARKSKITMNRAAHRKVVALNKKTSD